MALHVVGHQGISTVIKGTHTLRQPHHHHASSGSRSDVFFRRVHCSSTQQRISGDQACNDFVSSGISTSGRIRELARRATTPRVSAGKDEEGQFFLPLIEDAKDVPRLPSSLVMEDVQTTEVNAQDPPASIGAIIPFRFTESPSQSTLQPLGKDAAMGLVLSAVMGTGWTTFSGLEGPSMSTFPASPFRQSSQSPPKIHDGSNGESVLHPSSPRRSMRVRFTCNKCGERTLRAINPHAYQEGTIFVQCKGCEVFHKLVDNLNLFHELSGQVYQGSSAYGFAFHQSQDVLGADEGP